MTCGAISVEIADAFVCFIRAQVQRLRSSELQSRNSTSPSASPRGTSSSSPRGPAGKGGYLGEGPPLKVAKHSPGSSLRVDVENGIPALGKGASPSPKPISPAPMAGMNESLSSRYAVTVGNAHCGGDDARMEPCVGRAQNAECVSDDALETPPAEDLLQLAQIHHHSYLPRRSLQTHQERWAGWGNGGRLRPAGGSAVCVL